MTLFPRKFISREANETARYLMKRALPVYFWDGMKNFGDEIGPMIVARETGRPVVNARHLWVTPKTTYCTVGSLLHSLSVPNAVVWGSGFPEDVVAEGLRPPQDPKELRSVRGPLSGAQAEKLGWGDPGLYGDPGLLMPIYLPGASKAGDAPLVIPHFRFAERHMTALSSEIICPPWSEIETMVARISSARFIISSSLHGIILAEAYRRPWIWWRESADDRKGGELKFHDFFESLNVAEPAFVRDDFYTGDAGWIQKYAARACLGRESDLTARQADIRKAMPDFSKGSG